MQLVVLIQLFPLNPLDVNLFIVGSVSKNTNLMQKQVLQDQIDAHAIHVLPKDRDEYLDAMDSGNGGDLNPMESLIERLMASSILDLLDMVGTSEDELIDLNEASGIVPYGHTYLGLRCKQGEIPGVLSGHRWMTSERALKLYLDHKGRK